MHAPAHPHVGYDRSAAREDERAAAPDDEVPATIAAIGVEYMDYKAYNSEGAH